MTRRLLWFLGLVVALVIGLAAPASAFEVFFTELEGEQEAPGPGDPDGSGFAIVVTIPETNTICYGLFVSGIAPATAAHIHEAPVGDPGPVVLPLDAPTSGGSGGCVADEGGLGAEIEADPEAYYVNVHNADYPGGAVRGQLG
jgi:hypothetical protein